ncbi:MAG: Crp/Fnr family transcriptional regulator [Spirochaetia bacterium]|jgi:CRP/FNR family transcriptional regulator|nr:Crp/Fnr family transcriptional regulator [Spirochaetia bacterium]MCE1207845.1 Crp/Fnr family transcriptional regulator [Spirochaetia bacterium]MDD3821122.1 Crp/Fnr family transcriptional regulator [Spirochaetales bacterium]HOI23521.1 Crp/Fnr family transcriptional regulator [Spirochaetales bacterium]
MAGNCAHCARKDAPGSCVAIVPIFSALSPAEIDEIAAITADARFDKGSFVYFAGKEGRKLYIIHQGRVKISRIGGNGKSRVIRILGPGEFFGELSILGNAALSDYAEAVEPCSMCMIDGARLKSIMSKYPSIALKVMEELSIRLSKAESLIEDISLRPAESRLAQAILDLAAGRSEFELSTTKGDFASHLGMTQETLSRKLTLLQSQGLILAKGLRGIKILDEKRLLKAANVEKD